MRNTPKLNYLPPSANHKRDFGLCVNIEVASFFGGALGFDDSLVSISVFLGVLFGVSSGSFAGSSTSFLVGGSLVSEVLEELSVSLLFLEDILRYSLCPKTKHTKVRYDVSQLPNEPVKVHPHAVKARQRLKYHTLIEGDQDLCQAHWLKFGEFPAFHWDKTYICNTIEI